MNQCLRCSKPCAATSVFCDRCRALLRDQLQQGEKAQSEEGAFSNVVVESPTLVLTAENADRSALNGDSAEPVTSPHPIVKDPETPQPELYGDYADMVDHALKRLNEAAQRIAEIEQDQENGDASLHISRRIPRVSRLAPLRDISADIQRENTPLRPESQTPQTPQPFNVPKAPEDEQSQEEDLSQRMPDLWPWLQDVDADEGENENSANSTDPLISRHIPNSAEVARMEEEDIRRAIAEGQLTVPMPVHRPRSTYLRTIFIVLAILAALALIVDGLLVSLTFFHPQQKVNPTDGLPTLTLSQGVASIGQTVTLHIRHFSPSTRVLLTHDVQEQIQVNGGSPLINVNAIGDANASFVVDDSWGPGFHMIESEDVTTRYTASATLQIIGSGPTRPSHLVLETTSLNMGADVQGANTIQSLVLRNSGGGSITWAASSNSSWLLLTPTQGTFSSSQTLSVAVARSNLQPKDYTGKITLSSNVGPSQEIHVQMTVRPLPANAGPVLMVTPAVLSFTATDGSADPAAQLLVVGNPGSRPLNWSLSGINPGALASQSSLLRALNSKTSWLSADLTSGVVAAHSTMMVHISAQSQNLLPGVYPATLVFTANPAVLDSPQEVSVSLTVSPHCGLTLSAGNMSFTAVAGQNTPGNRTLTLTATSSCTGPLSWHAISSTSWLTVTPASGQLKAATSSVTNVAVNASGLAAGTYTGIISIVAGQSTQTAMVQLTVQVPTSVAAPLMAVSPLTLNFNTTQGSANPPSQAVTITNNGGSALHWRTTVNLLASSWLGVSPTGGAIAPSQTGQLTVTINNIASLTPGTYLGQITLLGTDASNNTAGGSPQTVTVNLLVLPICTLAQPSSSALAFTATQGSADPNAQLVAITGTGNCSWPSNWKATVTGPAPWLKLTPSSGQLLASGQSVNLSVAASLAHLKPGTYTAQVLITAIDGSGVPAQGSPQQFSVSLSVVRPCVLQTSVSSLSFTLPQGQSTSPVQNMILSETGNCARPVSWTVVGDSSWLVLSQGSGSDDGTGNGSTVGVSVDASSLTPGTYTGYITVSASGSGGGLVQRNPKTIPVSLTVTAFTISGTVITCSDSTCATPGALPNATLTLTNNSGTQVASVTADSSGNYVFNDLPLGTYTLIASGTDSSGTHYTATVSLDVTGNQLNFNVMVYPG